MHGCGNLIIPEQLAKIVPDHTRWEVPDLFHRLFFPSCVNDDLAILLNEEFLMALGIQVVNHLTDDIFALTAVPRLYIHALQQFFLLQIVLLLHNCVDRLF